MGNDDLLESGIKAAQEGNHERAASLLARYLVDEPNSDSGWLWLGRCRSGMEEKEYCFRRALKINPENAEARQALERLLYPGPAAGLENAPVATQSAQQSLPSSAPLAQPAPAAKSRNLPALLIGLCAGYALCAFAILAFSRVVPPGTLIPALNANRRSSPSLPPATASSTLTTTSTITPTLDLEARNALANDYVSKGLSSMAHGDYASAITSWTQVIYYLPDWNVGYSARGECYLRLLQNQRTQEEYDAYLESARRDFDAAIALASNNGDDYYHRYEVYDAIATNLYYRADILAYRQIALDNLELALRLGTYEESAERSHALVLIFMGRCEEGLAIARQLEAESSEPSAGINTIYAHAYACLGKSDKALKYIDTAIQIKDDPTRRFWRAMLLFSMVRLKEAKSELDELINADPYYAGYRYYLRGLIYAVQGDVDQAQADLEFGTGQTWDRGDLYLYALGKISLAQGDTASALNYFLEAEATHPTFDPILEMMRKDIKALNGTPREITPVRPDVTLIPTYTPSLTPRPTSTPLGKKTPTITLIPPPTWPITVDFDLGTGPFELQPDGSEVYHFQPAKAIPFKRVQSLIFRVDSNNDYHSFHVTISLYSPFYGMSGEVNLLPGNNQIEAPNSYVYPDGDIYAVITNRGEDPIQINNARFTLVVENEDGTISIYGITP